MCVDGANRGKVARLRGGISRKRARRSRTRLGALDAARRALQHGTHGASFDEHGSFVRGPK